MFEMVCGQFFHPPEGICICLWKASVCVCVCVCVCVLIYSHQIRLIKTVFSPCKADYDPMGFHPKMKLVSLPPHGPYMLILISSVPERLPTGLLSFSATQVPFRNSAKTPRRKVAQRPSLHS